MSAYVLMVSMRVCVYVGVRLSIRVCVSVQLFMFLYVSFCLYVSMCMYVYLVRVSVCTGNELDPYR